MIFPKKSEIHVTIFMISYSTAFVETPASLVFLNLLIVTLNPFV